jgi:hypothetical protein
MLLGIYPSSPVKVAKPDYEQVVRIDGRSVERFKRIMENMGYLVDEIEQDDFNQYANRVIIG